eukprot:547406-Pelagomonas_calceolata.AAC.7
MKLGGQFVDLQASCRCLEGQMDKEFKEVQVGTLVVWTGALKGGLAMNAYQQLETSNSNNAENSLTT